MNSISEAHLRSAKFSYVLNLEFEFSLLIKPGPVFVTSGGVIKDKARQRKGSKEGCGEWAASRPVASFCYGFGSLPSDQSFIVLRRGKKWESGLAPTPRPQPVL